MLSLLNELKQITAVSVLHDEQEVLRTLENFKETDDVRVSDLFENIDLLHHLLL